MTTQEYLKGVLGEQTIAADSDEMKALDSHQAQVTAIIEKAFPESSPSIGLGGSRIKGTMIRESYDLDMTCYFPHEDSEPGESLKAIYASVKKSLEEKYFVQEKRSSLRLQGKGTEDYKRDFHVDVVPGRYVDEQESDTYLHQNGGEKGWLKTNLNVHIAHVKKSGVLDAIRLMKLWRVRNGITFKTFVLELLVIKLLDKKKSASLDQQLTHVWTQFRDESMNLSVEDPANPNNDLKPSLDSVRTLLSIIAATTLTAIESSGWEAVFGKLKEDDDDSGTKTAGLYRAAAAVITPTKPWLPM